MNTRQWALGLATLLASGVLLGARDSRVKLPIRFPSFPDATLKRWAAMIEANKTR